MAQSAARAVVFLALVRPTVEIRDLLYKDDHPRAIDRYIDFFGDGVTSLAGSDGCGELLLESLA